ncbi:unnamed protein product, partial [Allacma fusca]
MTVGRVDIIKRRETALGDGDGSRVEQKLEIVFDI